MNDERDPRLEPLLGTDAGVVDLEGLFAGVERDIERSKAQRLTKLREMPTTTRRLIASASLVLLAAFVWFGLPRPDLHAISSWHYFAGVAGLLALAVMGAWSALRPTHKPELTSSRTLALSALAVVSTVVIAFLPAPHEHVMTVPPPHVNVAFATMRCMLNGLVIAFPVYFLVRFLDRGNYLGAVLAGCAAGLVANVALQLHCPMHATRHYLGGHTSVLLVSLIGAFCVVIFERRRANV